LGEQVCLTLGHGRSLWSRVRVGNGIRSET
jgi:hypothetical protein